MPVSVVFPKFNLEKTSGEISSWSVSEGDQVAAGDALFEVEDDKAAVEVESTESGFIGGLAEVGEEIDVGTVVATIYATKEELESVKATPTSEAPEVISVAEPEDPAKTPPPQPAKATRGSDANPTPLARRIARENGLTLDGLIGTGPRGRVQKRDVMAELECIAKLPAADIPTAEPLPPSSASTLNTLRFQKGEGLPVVFLHGFGSDRTSWGAMLSGARYDWPALALDLPGHGLSGAEVPADLDGIAAAVEATLLGQGVTDMVLSAHSFGGAVAARVASRGNLRIRGLCLFAPAGLSAQIDPGFIGGMTRARSIDSLRPWLLQLVEDSSLITDVFYERAMAARATDQQFNALQRFADTFFPDATQRFNVVSDLANYQGPVRVVHGRQDRIIPVDATRNLPGNAAVHLWDRCGHMPQFEHRTEALQVLEEVRRSV